MLSYQHIYHAGNRADVHKHAALAVMLDYLTRKDKPLSYLETHAGRGLYDLTAPEATKTGEAQEGIARLAAGFRADHPFAKAQARIKAAHGPDAYGGSPLIAAQMLRPTDRLYLAELHPQEFQALGTAMRADGTGPLRQVYHQDGFELAQSVIPPDPKRGLILIDPSYEVKEDYTRIPRQIAALHRKWNIGVICLWYPILGGPSAELQQKMLAELTAAHPEALRHDLDFGAARAGHRMTGSGLFILNPPYGLAPELDEIAAIFTKLRA